MAERGERTSELWRGARRGSGWALGFVSVLGLGSVLSRGGEPTVKAAMKAGLRARRAGAEAMERVQDIYAEAESEYAAETLSQDRM